MAVYGTFLHSLYVNDIPLLSFSFCFHFCLPKLQHYYFFSPSFELKLNFFSFSFCKLRPFNTVQHLLTSTNRLCSCRSRSEGDMIYLCKIFILTNKLKMNCMKKHFIKTLLFNNFFYYCIFSSKFYYFCCTGYCIHGHCNLFNKTIKLLIKNTSSYSFKIFYQTALFTIEAYRSNPPSLIHQIYLIITSLI